MMTVSHLLYAFCGFAVFLFLFGPCLYALANSMSSRKLIDVMSILLSGAAWLQTSANADADVILGADFNKGSGKSLPYLKYVEASFGVSQK